MRRKTKSVNIGPCDDKIDARRVIFWRHIGLSNLKIK